MSGISEVDQDERPASYSARADKAESEGMSSKKIGQRASVQRAGSMHLTTSRKQLHQRRL